MDPLSMLLQSRTAAPQNDALMMALYGDLAGAAPMPRGNRNTRGVRSMSRWGLLPTGEPMPISGYGVDAYYRSIGTPGTNYGDYVHGLTGDWRAR